MNEFPVQRKIILITGAARRPGRVFALALGAILPLSDGNKNPDIIKNVPLHRWADLQEVEQALLFLLTGLAYVTGEIIHVDGGRHLI